MEDERIDEWLYSLDPVTLKVVCALIDYVYKDIRRRILEEGGVKLIPHVQTNSIDIDGINIISNNSTDLLFFEVRVLNITGEYKK